MNAMRSLNSTVKKCHACIPLHCCSVLKRFFLLPRSGRVIGQSKNEVPLTYQELNRENSTLLKKNYKFLRSYRPFQKHDCKTQQS